MGRLIPHIHRKVLQMSKASTICSKCLHVCEAPVGTTHRHRLPKKDRVNCGGVWIDANGQEAKALQENAA